MVQSGSRARYPFHAVLLIVAAGVLFLFNMTLGFLFMALVPPMIPMFVCVLFGSGSLVQSALHYAQRVSNREPAAMLRLGKHDEEVGHSVPTHAVFAAYEQGTSGR